MSSASPSSRLIGGSPLPSDRIVAMTGWLLSTLAILGFALVIWQVTARNSLSAASGWPTVLLILTTTTATLIAQSRHLPGLRVLGAAVIIGVIGSTAHWVGAQTSIPFGPFTCGDASGPKLFGNLAWATPLIWIIIVFNTRGVARLILKPWRKLKHYGFWVIGITTVLVVLLDLAMEPYATRVWTYWVWLPTTFPLTWHHMPWTNSLGWALATLLMLAFATPLLINRSSRSRKAPPDYHPLAVWWLLLTLFGVGSATVQLWSATLLCGVLAVTTTVFAVRGARW